MSGDIKTDTSSTSEEISSGVEFFYTDLTQGVNMADIEIVTCSEHFTEEEMRCKHTGESKLDKRFIDKLEEVRKHFDKPMPVTSGYRHPTHPVEARKGSLSGYHIKGRACDIAVDRGDALKLIQIALAHGMFGIGVQQKGSSRFIHLDDRPEAEMTIWSY